MYPADLRARAVDARTVSYTLPRSLNELLRLEYGRRKAYEVRSTCCALPSIKLNQCCHSGAMLCRSKGH